MFFLCFYWRWCLHWRFTSCSQDQRWRQLLPTQSDHHSVEETGDYLLPRCCHGHVLLFIKHYTSVPVYFTLYFGFIHLRTAAFPVKPAAIIKAPLIFSLIMFDCTNNPLNLNGMRHSKHVFSGKVLIRCIIKTLPRNTFIVSHSTSSSAVLPRAADRVRSIHGSDQSLQSNSQNTTQLFGC